MTKSDNTPAVHSFMTYLKGFLKFAFVAGLLFFLVKKGFISLEATHAALQHWDKMTLSLLAVFASTAMGVTRWQWLLRAQKIHLTWLRVLQLTLIGVFFNIALPGAVSGDFVKAFYIGKSLKTEKSRAFGSILFDRVAGLSALVLVSAGALILGLDSFIHSPLFSSIRILIVSTALSFLVFYAYLFLVKTHHDPVLKLFKRVERHYPKVEALTRIYESLRQYHHHRLTVAKVLGISILIHLTAGWCCLNYAQALGENHLSLLSVYVVVPLGLLVTAIPIAPAGVGTGNVAFLYFFGLIGSERGADVFSLYALSQIVVSAIGGIVYFRFKADPSNAGLVRS